VIDNNKQSNRIERELYEDLEPIQKMGGRGRDFGESYALPSPSPGFSDRLLIRETLK
jgi:hypothetical protein